MTGGITDRRSRYPLWNCDRRFTEPGNGDYVVTRNDQAETYSAGFELPVGADVFTGNATSGYSEAVRVLFRFGDARDGYWCGDTGGPLTKGQRVQGFRR